MESVWAGKINYLETTDGRFRRIAKNYWWEMGDARRVADDTEVVSHLNENPRVSLIIITEDIP